MDESWRTCPCNAQLLAPDVGYGIDDEPRVPHVPGFPLVLLDVFGDNDGFLVLEITNFLDSTGPGLIIGLYPVDLATYFVDEIEDGHRKVGENCNSDGGDDCSPVLPSEDCSHNGQHRHHQIPSDQPPVIGRLRPIEIQPGYRGCQPGYSQQPKQVLGCEADDQPRQDQLAVPDKQFFVFEE
jgi:hypothetical protein